MITHIQKQRMMEVSTDEFVREAFDMDLLIYNTAVYEIGLMFLDSIFPENDPDYEPTFKAISIQKAYWTWWRREWMVYQQELLEFVKIHDMDICYEFWREEMELMNDRKDIVNSFENYLKLFTNEILRGLRKTTQKEAKRA